MPRTSTSPGGYAWGLALAAALAGICLTLLVGWHFSMRMPVLTGDVFLITKAPPVVGLLSNLGAFAWLAALVVLAFTISILPRQGEHPALSFLVSAALLTLVLFVDDFFMFHDFWLRRWAEKMDAAYYAALAMATLIHLFAFRNNILASRYGLLLVALVFFALSVAMDLFQEQGTALVGHWQYLIEDGIKWAGICFWCAYHWSVCSAVLADSSAQTHRRA